MSLPTMHLYGQNVSRETAESAGEAYVQLLQAVAENLGTPLNILVGGVNFCCDRCGYQQDYDDDRSGWHHAAGDDICPECLLGGGR